MSAEELEKFVARHEMQCLELKDSFSGECDETVCAFANDMPDCGKPGAFLKWR